MYIINYLKEEFKPWFNLRLNPNKDTNNMEERLVSREGKCYFEKKNSQFDSILLVFQDKNLVSQF